MSRADEACGACGSPCVPDQDGVPGVLYPTCDCTSCPRCGSEFKADDPNGVSIGASDEDAAAHDPHDDGLCAACWRIVKSGPTMRRR